MTTLDNFGTTFERVSNVVVSQLGVDHKDVTPDAYFADLGAGPLDSLEVTALMIALEDEFDLEIDDAEMRELRTVQDVTNFVDSRS